jgi:hypothetical protein
MTPHEKVKAGYLTFNENFVIQQPFTVISKRERWVKVFWYTVKYCYRKWFNKPVTWQSKLKEYQKVRTDLSQIDPTAFYKLQKKLNA